MKQTNPPGQAISSTAVAPPAAEQRREAVRQHLQHQFRRAGNDVTTQALLRAVLEYRLERLE